MRHQMRSIGMSALALGLSVGAGLPAEIGGPGQFPGCPDPASVSLAYRDEGSGVASLLRPERRNLTPETLDLLQRLFPEQALDPCRQP